MKKIFLIITILTVILSLAGCEVRNAGTEGEDGKLKIVATIFPQYDFARNIAGDAADVSMLLPPGTESHSYEPTPQDIIKVQNCDVFIYTGGGSDEWIEKVLDSMDTSDMKIISLMDCVTAEGGKLEESEHVHGGETVIENDEHVWTSPKNAVKIVNELAASFAEKDSGNADGYRARAAEYVGALENLDKKFEKAVSDGTRDTIVFGDRFPFKYLARDYGFKYIAAYEGCADDSEPSAAKIAELIDITRARQVSVVFYRELSNQKIADAICAQTGAQKRLMHSCHTVTRGELEDGATYLELMNKNADALREALE